MTPSFGSGAATALLRGAARATATARAAAEPHRLTVGYTNVLVTAAVRELRRAHPEAEVHSLHVPYDEPRTALLDHRVDVVVARLPFGTDGLDVTVLYDERRLLLVPSDHRLAGKESVGIDDIAGEPLARLAGDPAWNAFWRVDPRPDGSPAPDGPLVEAIEDKFELIAAGEAVAIIPDDPNRPRGRPGLTTVPLTGVEPSHVAMATRAGDRSPLVTAARRVLRAYLRPPATSE